MKITEQSRAVTYTMEMTEEEAKIIMSLLGSVQAKTPAHPLYMAFSDAGITASHKVVRPEHDWQGYLLEEYPF